LVKTQKGKMRNVETPREAALPGKKKCQLESPCWTSLLIRAPQAHAGPKGGKKNTEEKK